MSQKPAREILANNLRRQIEHDQKGSRYSVRAWALARGLEVRLVDRMTKGENSFTLDKLELVAAACNVPAWQLLLPEFTPGEPADVPISDEDRAMLVRLRRLLGDT